MKVVCQYHPSDVRACFPDHDDRSVGHFVNFATWAIDVIPWGCDGIVALSIGDEDARTLTLTMNTSKARELAAMLIARADAEDAKLDDDDDDGA